MNMKTKNPFRMPFFAVAMICCIILSAVFYYISITNQRALQKKLAEEKVEMCMEDWENQLEQMKGIALRLVSNYEFNPSYFQTHLDRKWNMLDTFAQYKYYCALTDEYFLDYGDGQTYLSSGHTMRTDLFLKMKSADEQEWEIYQAALQQIRKELGGICGTPNVLRLFDDVYILIPFRISQYEGTAVLGFIVKESAIEERFQFAGSRMQGCVTLYNTESALYFNQAEPCSPEQSGVVNAISRDGLYRICYLPEKVYSFQTNTFFLQLLLVVADVALVFIIANFFAERSYKPLWTLAETYRQKTSTETDLSENALDELKIMMDQMLQSNRISNLQIQENQKILQVQVLKMIISGSVSDEIELYLEKAQICLPGPVYFVVSISYADDTSATNAFLNQLQKEIEQIPDESAGGHVYTICNNKKKLINAICSVHLEEQAEEFTETICELAESFTAKPSIGIGNVCHSLRHLSASWLESMDEIHNGKQSAHKQESGPAFVYQAEEMHRIIDALEDGNKNAALSRLDEFIGNEKNGKISFLMLQYIVSDFLGEMRKLEEKYNLKASKKSVSHLLAVKDIESFGIAAENIICEYFNGYIAMKYTENEENMRKICEYIQAHFMEYGISSEGVAAAFHVSTDTVRQAVVSQTGMLYRDYLIHLRIEYAKVLLRQEDIPIAELCQKVGYGNVSYFIKLFREVTGITPSKYRKNCLNK